MAASNAGEVVNQVQQSGGGVNVPNNPPSVSAQQIPVTLLPGPLRDCGRFYLVLYWVKILIGSVAELATS